MYATLDTISNHKIVADNDFQYQLLYTLCWCVNMLCTCHHSANPYSLASPQFMLHNVNATGAEE